ncbi:MAG: hypothetical protein ACW98A_02690 [Candidatus Hodarchaeales archaeon]|jgi:hypothetical protein
MKNLNSLAIFLPLFFVSLFIIVRIQENLQKYDFILLVLSIISIIPIGVLSINYLVNQRIQEYQKNSYRDNFKTTYSKNEKLMKNHHKWEPVKLKPRQ